MNPITPDTPLWSSSIVLCASPWRWRQVFPAIRSDAKAAAIIGAIGESLRNSGLEVALVEAPPTDDDSAEPRPRLVTPVYRRRDDGDGGWVPADPSAAPRGLLERTSRAVSAAWNSIPEEDLLGGD